MVDFSFIQNIYLPEPILEFLRADLFGLMIFDVWLIVHFISGGILFFLITKYSDMKRGRVELVIVLLFIYELFEFFLWTQNLIIREPITNIGLDIFMGILGAWTVERYTG